LAGVILGKMSHMPTPSPDFGIEQDETAAPKDNGVHCRSIVALNTRQALTPLQVQVEVRPSQVTTKIGMADREGPRHSQPLD